MKNILAKILFLLLLSLKITCYASDIEHHHLEIEYINYQNENYTINDNYDICVDINKNVVVIYQFDNKNQDGTYIIGLLIEKDGEMFFQSLDNDTLHSAYWDKNNGIFNVTLDKYTYYFYENKTINNQNIPSSTPTNTPIPTKTPQPTSIPKVGSTIDTGNSTIKLVETHNDKNGNIIFYIRFKNTGNKSIYVSPYDFEARGNKQTLEWGYNCEDSVLYRNTKTLRGTVLPGEEIVGSLCFRGGRSFLIGDQKLLYIPSINGEIYYFEF